MESGKREALLEAEYLDGNFRKMISRTDHLRLEILQVDSI